jgi:hypothetical protein
MAPIRTTAALVPALASYDGFPSEDEFNVQVEQYLSALEPSHREKALITQ